MGAMPKYLRWTLIGVGGLAGVAVALAILAVAYVYIASQVMMDRTYPKPPDSIHVAATPAAIEQGKHLAAVEGCGGCHGESLGGALMPDIPGSKVYAPNLTLLGKLSDADIDRVLRRAIMPDGKAVMVMPVHAYANFTDSEASAIIAYIRSLEPRGTETPGISFGLMVRAGIALGKFTDERTAIATGKLPLDAGARYAQGRHLALIVCGTCHQTALQGDPDNPFFHPPDLTIAAAYERADFHTLMR